MLYDLPVILCRCFICTVIVECLLAFALKVRKLNEQLIVVLVNAMTNPLLVCITTLIQPRIDRTEYYIVLVVLELIAFVSEALVYKYVLKPKINPFLLSLILNSASYLIGMLINKIIY